MHTWSLGVEMSFYLILPLILIFLIKLLKQKQIIFFIIIISILSLIFIEYIYTKGLVFETDLFKGFFYGKYISDTLFYNAPFRLFEFFFGCILCFIPKKHYSDLTNQIFFILGLILIFCSILIIDYKSKIPGVSLIPAMIGTSFIIFFN